MKNYKLQIKIQNKFDFLFCIIIRKKIHKKFGGESDKPSFKSRAWILTKKERQRRQVIFKKKAILKLLLGKGCQKRHKI